MLTRLKVSGFKNLVDVDIRFGPFTCIAGANGVGKSNLFDAIRFLSALADMPLMDAAASVRDEAGRSRDIRALFHRVGLKPDPEMEFDAEMIIPRTGVDDLGQHANASITFLRYKVRLAYRDEDETVSGGSLHLVEETLEHINRSESQKHLPFNPGKVWRDSVIGGKRSGGAFISTENGTIHVHQDGGGGKPRSFLAESVPRTLVSVANATESPTSLLVRREMQSWRLLQLEPSALRRPDEFTAPSRLGTDGAHVPAALYRLAREAAKSDPEQVDQPYAAIAYRLSRLIENILTVSVDRDERRELLTLIATLQDGTTHSAKALSDGTLRFLALSVLELDPQETGVICLEEPENGIHPARIPAMLQLLQDIATDTQEPVDETNPLRQVIINTHSPAVVQQVPEESLIVAQLTQDGREGVRFQRASFGYLHDTWRERAAAAAQEPIRLIPKGDLLKYLNPTDPSPESAVAPTKTATKSKATDLNRRVIDRTDLQPYLFPMDDAVIGR